MIKYFLVILAYGQGQVAVPQYYETLPACRQAGEVAKGEYTASGVPGYTLEYTCVPWNSEAD